MVPLETQAFLEALVDDFECVLHSHRLEVVSHVLFGKGEVLNPRLQAVNVSALLFLKGSLLSEPLAHRQMLPYFGIDTLQGRLREIDNWKAVNYFLILNHVILILIFTAFVPISGRNRVFGQLEDGNWVLLNRRPVGGHPVSVWDFEEGADGLHVRNGYVTPFLLSTLT